MVEKQEEAVILTAQTEVWPRIQKTGCPCKDQPASRRFISSDEFSGLPLTDIAYALQQVPLIFRRAGL